MATVLELSAFLRQRHPDERQKHSNDPAQQQRDNQPRVRKELRQAGVVTSAEVNNGVRIDKAIVRVVALLKACVKHKDLRKGASLHSRIKGSGLLERSLYVANALLSMYAKCGALHKAQQVLDELPVRDVVTWSALIAGYVQHECAADALDCFKQMQCEGFLPDAVTFVCILKACALAGAATKGRQIHEQIASQGLLGSSLMLATALIDMYAKCGELPEAQQVLDELPVRNVVTWSALIAGYTQHGHGEEALKCFERMQCEGCFPNVVTFSCSLRACAIVGAVTKGKQIHDEIVRRGLMGTNLLLDTALVDMYAKCGALPKAQEVLDELPIHDVVSWNVLIAGYAQHRHGEGALNCFERMQQEGLCPDLVTFISILKACAVSGAVGKGKEIHDQIVRQGMLGTDIMLATALVDMYAKCGELPEAQRVFDELPDRNVATWNALMTGYAQHRHSEETLNCFKQMQRDGLCPNAVTINCVLTACSHSGLVDQAQKYYESMSTNYGIMPDLEHYTCMVDLFGRVGQFDKAIDMLKRMPYPDYLPAWDSLLGACLKWGNVKLGRFAFEHAIRLDKTDESAYICMQNIYAAAGMQEEADKIEAWRVKNETWKKPG